MEKIKVLNLYAGIGGNRKLWENVEVTAVEKNNEIAKIYKHFFPNDKIIVTDAHEYLLNNHMNFDFIWSSFPCQTHSELRNCKVRAGLIKPVYPDLGLYQEIILLKNLCKCPFVVENVNPYYNPLIPGKLIDRHLFWSNFFIPEIKLEKKYRIEKINATSTVYGFNISKFKLSNRKDQVLRNLVNPKLGLHIFNIAMKINKCKNNRQFSLLLE